MINTNPQANSNCLIITKENLIKAIDIKLNDGLLQIIDSEKELSSSQLGQALNSILKRDLSDVVDTTVKRSYLDINESSFESFFFGEREKFLDAKGDIKEGMEEQEMPSNCPFPPDLKAVSGWITVTFCDLLDLEELEAELDLSFTVDELNWMSKLDNVELDGKFFKENFSDTVWEFEAINNSDRLKLTYFERCD